MSIVKTDINYTYEIMMTNIYELNNKFSFLKVQNAGYSVLGKTLPVIRLRQRS